MAEAAQADWLNGPSPGQLGQVESYQLSVCVMASSNKGCQGLHLHTALDVCQLLSRLYWTRPHLHPGYKGSLKTSSLSNAKAPPALQDLRLASS